MVGRESSAGSYLADLTSPIPSHCASIVATSTVRVNTVFFCGSIKLELEEEGLDPDSFNCTSADNYQSEFNDTAKYFIWILAAIGVIIEVKHQYDKPILVKNTFEDTFNNVYPYLHHMVI